jgi:fructose-bisphosphate aldolase class II
VRKVNIDTDCRLAMAAAIRKIATRHRSEFDPRAFMKPAIVALRDLCKQRFEAFGAAGQASRLRPTALTAMARQYSNGCLDPVFSVSHAA